MLKYIFFLLSFSPIFGLLANTCSNSNLFPTTPTQVPQYKDQMLLVHDQITAGDYFVIEGLAYDEEYRITSSTVSDYFTVRGRNNYFVYGFGNSGLSYFATNGPLVYIHVNTDSSCGENSEYRKVYIECMTCDEEPSKVGVRTVLPKSTLDVNGEIKIKDSGRAPLEGMIKYDTQSKDFYGYNGTEWLSLTRTKGSSWGNVPTYTSTPGQSFPYDHMGNIDYEPLEISIYDNIAAIGDPDREISGLNNTGQVDIYVKQGEEWILEAELRPLDADPMTLFGKSVAMYDDILLVGAEYDDIDILNKGVVYIFKRLPNNTWEEVGTIFSANAESFDYFGYSIDFDGIYAVISSPGTDVNGENDRGAVHIYERFYPDNFILRGTFTDPNGEANDEFGTKVVIDGEQFAATNRYTKIRLYEKSSGPSWVFDEQLEGEPSDGFAKDLDLDNGTLVVAAPYSDYDYNEGQGSLLIYEKQNGSFTLIDEISSQGEDSYARLGYAVSIDNDIIVAGAYHGTINALLGDQEGYAIVFEKSQDKWQQSAILTMSRPMSGSEFGITVGVKGESIAVSALDISGIADNNYQVAIYFFDKNK